MVRLDDHQAWHLAPEEARVQFFPMQIQLRARTKTNLPHHHAGMICALVKAALNTSTPDGILIDYPEQCRTQLLPDELYNFGVTIFSTTSSVANDLLQRLIEGLRRVGTVGTNGRAACHGLHGNFDVVQAISLIDGRNADDPLTYVSSEYLRQQINEVRQQREVSLWFRTPLHCKRPGSARGSEAKYFDNQSFFPDVFLRRASKRCFDLGLLKAIPEILPEHVEVVENRLIWQHLKYGSENTPLMGAAGAVRLRLHNVELAEVLVRAQYARVGEKTNFGFGAFCIEGLQTSTPKPYRSEGVVDMSIRRAESRRLDDSDVIARDRLSQFREILHSGAYVPRPVDLIMVPSDNSNRPARQISVVDREDRAIQACIIRELATAFAGLHEDQCRAYRKVAKCNPSLTSWGASYDKNYDSCAIETRFDPSIASIEHREMEDLLRVCLSDDQLSELLMSWIRSGSADSGRGLPTVSPMTRPLASLFLTYRAHRLRDSQVETEVRTTPLGKKGSDNDIIRSEME